MNLKIWITYCNNIDKAEIALVFLKICLVERRYIIHYILVKVFYFDIVLLLSISFDCFYIQLFLKVWNASDSMFVDDVYFYASFCAMYQLFHFRYIPIFILNLRCMNATIALFIWVWKFELICIIKINSQSNSIIGSWQPSPYIIKLFLLLSHVFFFYDGFQTLLQFYLFYHILFFLIILSLGSV